MLIGRQSNAAMALLISCLNFEFFILFGLIFLASSVSSEYNGPDLYALVVAGETPVDQTCVAMTFLRSPLRNPSRNSFLAFGVSSS